MTEQGNRSGIIFEIIVIDDGSAAEYKEQNATISELVYYIELDRNIGRSRIRNLFTGYANYEELLFLDCDSEIIKSDFLEQYLLDINETGAPVICGGRIHTTENPVRNKRLRWRFGIERESLSANDRNKCPYRYFMTNNFVIDRKVLEDIRFDERIVNYGYEDTLFAYRLMKNGLAVIHTDNPVMHSFNETNDEFLEKTEQSIGNLDNILAYIENDSEFIDSIRILRVSDKLKKLGISGLFRLVFKIIRVPLRFLLKIGSENLFLFDIYKLGLLKIRNKKKSSRYKTRKDL